MSKPNPEIRAKLESLLDEYRNNSGDFASIANHDLNEELYLWVLKCLGIGNHQNAEVSGERWFLERHLNSSNMQGQLPVVLDIGANKGAYAEQVLAIRPDAQVIAFEPSPTAFKVLREKSIDIGFAALPFGCSDKDEELVLFDYADSPGSEHASVYQEQFRDNLKAEATGHAIKCITVDNFLESQQITNIDLLKIDVEGHEMAVLRGAETALREGRIRAVHFEFNEMHVHAGVFFKDFFDFFNGFALFRLLPDGMVALPHYNPAMCEIFGFQNIVALRKG